MNSLITFAYLHWIELAALAIALVAFLVALREAIDQHRAANEILDRVLAEHGTAPRLHEIPLSKLLDDYDRTDRLSRHTDVTSEAL